MKCLPLEGRKVPSNRGKSYFWINKAGLYHSFSDQASSFEISPWGGIKYFEWRENGFYERGYGKPYKISYKKDGSVHIIAAQGYTKINELKVRDMHRDYHDNWHEYLARYKKI